MTSRVVRQLCRASAGAVFALALAGGAVVAADAPSFRVERSTLDLGTVRAGEDVVATFVFRNDGDHPVKIVRAKPS